MRTLLFAGFLFTLAGPVKASATRPPGCDAMVGVWEYVAPSAPGHAIIARQGTRYLGIFVNTLAQPYDERTNTRAADSSARSEPDRYSVAGAWEYTCEAGSDRLRLTLRWLYSSYRTQDVGSEVVLEVELAGRQAKWWYIGADGKRGGMGAGRLLP